MATVARLKVQRGRAGPLVPSAQLEAVLSPSAVGRRPGSWSFLGTRRRRYAACLVAVG